MKEVFKRVDDVILYYAQELVDEVRSRVSWSWAVIVSALMIVDTIVIAAAYVILFLTFGKDDGLASAMINLVFGAIIFKLWVWLLRFFPKDTYFKMRGDVFSVGFRWVLLVYGVVTLPSDIGMNELWSFFFVADVIGALDSFLIYTLDDPDRAKKRREAREKMPDLVFNGV